MASFRKAKSGQLTGSFPLWRLPIRLMTCPVCGKPQPCAHNRSNTAVALQRDCGDETVLAASSRSDRVSWRQEIASRVQQHRARRRRRNYADGSLELEFPPLEVAPAAVEQAQTPLPAGVDTDAANPISNSLAEPRKIIRFPRMAPAETVPASRAFVEELELADPAPAAPRIFEAPEAYQMDLLSGLAEITWDQPEVDREELGPPPQPAPLHQRAFAGLVDGLIVLAGVAAFAVAFLKMSAASLPLQGRAAFLVAGAVCLALWLLFQYIFLVYGQHTPGMRIAGLELCDFDGEPASVAGRRHRVFAALQSALSLGLGFAWAFVDEDTLGWHDRISGTYVRKSDQRSAVSTQFED